MTIGRPRRPIREAGDHRRRYWCHSCHAYKRLGHMCKSLRVAQVPALYWNMGLSSRQVAVKLAVSKSTVNRYLKTQGFSRRKRGNKYRGRP